jgi:hypothetical protein
MIGMRKLLAVNSNLFSGAAVAIQILSDRLPGARLAKRWQLIASVTAVLAKLRILAPYAAIELILPGGSILALLLWFYRRQKGLVLPVQP